ncbi:hypothetical protein [Methanoculleus chikugoensis]|uniref:hypothetical protein n=1 Tax=Methanoculleus chikugoensis TaxID=118126 RepID=UPI000A48CC89|nr:hypothetical protein [Methanoculleus chikugoensis]
MNNIDDQAQDIRKAQMFKDKNTECQKILAIQQCDAEKVGLIERPSNESKHGYRRVGRSTSRLGRLGSS